MRFSFLFFVIFLFSSTAWPSVEICDYIDLPGCSGIQKQGRRSSNQSSPSPTTAASSNPANVSLDKGFGIEGLYQPTNPVGISILSGTGKVGGSLISPNLENSFFGNRVAEIDNKLLERQLSKSRYRNKKLNFAFATKIINKKYFSLDLGVPLKRNPDIGKINTGIGLSSHFLIFNFGFSAYYDDVYFNLENFRDPHTFILYKDTYGKEDYSEKFLVKALSIGFKVGAFSFDFGEIKSKYNFYVKETKIDIYSTGLVLGNFRFNYALRKEHSDRQVYVDHHMIDRRLKTNEFYGLQYSFFKKVIVGITYNYFLLNDVALTTAFFL